MKEYHLQMAWKLSILAGKKMYTIQGNVLQIIHPGYGPNEEGGPDFSMAKIKLDDTLWVGSVEVHTSSSLWYTHKHAGDPKYDNVILHVVWEHDKSVLGNSGDELPCIQLKDYISHSWFVEIEEKINSEQFIPCARHFSEVPSFIFNAQLDVMLVERLETRLKKIDQLYLLCEKDWDECLHRFLGHFMGQKVNNMAMELLAQSIPLKIIAKHRDSLIDIEALLFGQGGFLQGELNDTYFKVLKERYLYLAHKYQLEKTYGIQHLWQYKGIRPLGFPERCIAKWAYLLFMHHRLLHWMLDEDLDHIVHQTEHIGSYWESHYRFGKTFRSPLERKKKVQTSLCINVIIPFRIAYKKHVEQLDIGTYLNYYEDLKPEQNKIVALFNTLGYTSKSIRDSQALLQLYNNYCNYRKCLSCKAGHFILKKEGLV